MTGKDLKMRLVRIILICAGGAACIAVFYFLADRGIGLACPLYALTGLQCPGCGNSRAALRLLKFDFAGAFACNPFFFAEVGYIAWVLVKSCAQYLRGGRFHYTPPIPALDILLLVMFVLWGIVRNFL